MKNDTLPVHSFCEFSLKEVTLRMACVYLGSQSACMDYCGIMQVEQNTTLLQKFDCYEKFKVDISLYG